MPKKSTASKGEFDYDYDNDILFFKASERDYLKSIELDNVVVDVDKQGFVVGVQIMDASSFLKLDKTRLSSIKNWMFEADLENDRLEIRLLFQIQVHNKIIEKNPIIVQHLNEHLPNSQLTCQA